MTPASDGWCLWFHKDTNLKAIHNEEENNLHELEGVYGSTKILIWKQFTTTGAMVIAPWGCLWFHKDTNLKAIHNTNDVILIKKNGVYGSTKILIWKQFTTL